MSIFELIDKQKQYCLNFGLINKLLELREIEKTLLKKAHYSESPFK
jgi:hypothetical protein